MLSWNNSLSRISCLTGFEQNLHNEDEIVIKHMFHNSINILKYARALCGHINELKTYVWWNISRI